MVGLIQATVPLLINRHYLSGWQDRLPRPPNFGTGITPVCVSQLGHRKPFRMNKIDAPNPGQAWARTRWNSHGSGAAFDRKKQPYLAPAMKVFAESQDFCIVSFVDNGGQVSGRLLHGRLGEFAKVPDDHHLIMQPLNRTTGDLLSRKACARSWRLGLMFIEFKTRKRLCVHATGKWEETEGCLALEVTQSVFHCAKYIDPSYQIARFAARRPRTFKTAEFTMPAKHGRLIHQLADFLTDQRVAFVCTVDRNGQCAVNHRGGKCGFVSVNGVQGEAWVLLPDYAGNGAFEAVGNIWETRRAAVFVPDPERGYGVCVSGPAELFDGEVLQTEPFVRLSGAQRVLAIRPLYCQVQSWNDDLGPEEAQGRPVAPTEQRIC
jgi:hypothetical protein